MNIAVVDDEYYTRKALSKCIGDCFRACCLEEIAVLECDRAEALLPLIRETNIDFVFTDIRMGEMDGLALCEELNRLHPEIEIVIISGYAEFVYAQKAIQSHVFRYLLKPVDENELLAIAGQLLQKRALSGRAPAPRSAAKNRPVIRYLDAITQKMIEYDLTRGKINQLEELIGAYLDNLIRAGRVDLASCHLYYHEVIFCIQRSCDDAEMAAALKDSLNQIALRPFASFEEARTFFSGLIAQISRIAGCFVDSQQMLVRNLIQYIEEHYAEDLNLNDIARNNFFMHPNYLSRLLKNATGVSFSKFLLDTRMKNAVSLVGRKELSIAMVAQLVGYTSESYFVQVFRRYFGKTPGAYRKELRLKAGRGAVPEDAPPKYI